MELIDLFKLLTVHGMKLTIEYNYDYDTHLITASIDDIEGKALIHMKDIDTHKIYYEYTDRDIRQMINRVIREKQRRVLANANDK